MRQVKIPSDWASLLEGNQCTTPHSALAVATAYMRTAVNLCWQTTIRQRQQNNSCVPDILLLLFATTSIYLQAGTQKHDLHHSTMKLIRLPGLGLKSTLQQMACRTTLTARWSLLHPMWKKASFAGCGRKVHSCGKVISGIM